MEYCDQVRILFLWAVAHRVNSMFNVIFKINYRDQNEQSRRVSECTQRCSISDSFN